MRQGQKQCEHERRGQLPYALNAITSLINLARHSNVLASLLSFAYFGLDCSEPLHARDIDFIDVQVDNAAIFHFFSIPSGSSKHRIG